MKLYLSALALAAGACLNATAQAAESGLSEVMVVATDPQASEAGSDPAEFFIARNGGRLDVPLTVSFTLAGTATNGTDYVQVPPAVTLRAHEPIATIKISPRVDALVEGNETVVLNLVAKAGAYTLGSERTAAASIADATVQAGKSPPKPAGPVPAGTPGSPGSQGTPGRPGADAGAETSEPADGPDDLPPAHSNTSSRLPPPDRTGTLAVTVTFHAAGKWVSKTTPGVYSNLKWRRSYSYSVPLRGTYSAGAGFQEIERRQKHGPFVPNFRRYLVFQPRDLLGPAGRVCGKGDSMIQDDESGVAVGDPGMPPLVPFTRIRKGGGPFPSRDKTVPERDLCLTAVSIDFEQNVFHLRIDGSDAHVKVRTTLNGQEVGQPFNVRLQGDAEPTTVKSKLTFLNEPIPRGSNSGIDGQRVIENFSLVRGPDHSEYPMSATVTWKIAWK